MSLIGYFLAKEDQNPTNIKYLHSLLAAPVLQLINEKEALTQRKEVLESKISAQALAESKEFIQALGNTKKLINLESGLLTSLKTCQEETLRFKQQINTHSVIIESILKEQQRLESISNMQGVITEILDIPQLLKNLVNSRHYKDALQLLDFIEKIEIKQEVFREICESGVVMRKRLEDELVDMLAECFEAAKAQETLGHLSNLKRIMPGDEVKEFLKCKAMYFQKIVKKHNMPKASLLALFNAVHLFLRKTQEIFLFLFKNSEDLLVYFYLDIISIILQLFSKKIHISISDTCEISRKLQEINSEIFSPFGCNIWPEIVSTIQDILKQNILFYSNKTIVNFENLLKLYGWESSGTKENPMLEFGSMAVLYNNTLTLINEIR